MSRIGSRHVRSCVRVELEGIVMSRLNNLAVLLVAASATLVGCGGSTGQEATGTSTAAVSFLGYSASPPEVAFQANTGSLWSTGTAGTTNWQLGMMAGTSPSVAGASPMWEEAYGAPVSNAFEIAFQA